MHERDSKRKICAVFFSFWGLRPQTPTGAPPLDPAGGLPSPRPPQLCPPTSDPWRRHCCRRIRIQRL